MALTLENINKNFEEFQVSDINLEIQNGEYFVILGPSGAGKTLILEMIAGLLKPDSGKIHGTENKRTGFIYQDYLLFPHLNVFDNIAYGLKIRKSNKDSIRLKVEELAEKLEISHLLKRDVLTLSGGEKQRVATARAMIISPDIYLFDEPTAALDRNSRLKTQQLFLKIHKESGAIFLHVTHDFEEALSLADRIAVLKDGKILQCGKPDDIFNNPGSKEIADFLGYRNVFGGTIENYIFTVDDVKIMVPMESCAFAYIAIKSDDVIISGQPFESSARNSFKGTVTNVFKKASVVEVVLDIGIPLHVDITRKSCEEMNIKPGEKLWATFKVSALKVFEHK
ncbi:MAG: ATP-binding cassette domain-containing protein [bacterium]|nr:ATP-binding cassette domain-containing protein [bacterium]